MVCRGATCGLVVGVEVLHVGVEVLFFRCATFSMQAFVLEIFTICFNDMLMSLLSADNVHMLTIHEHPIHEHPITTFEVYMNCKGLDSFPKEYKTHYTHTTHTTHITHHTHYTPHTLHNTHTTHHTYYTTHSSTIAVTSAAKPETMHAIALLVGWSGARSAS